MEWVDNPKNMIFFNYQKRQINKIQINLQVTPLICLLCASQDNKRKFINNELFLDPSIS